MYPTKPMDPDQEVEPLTWLAFGLWLKGKFNMCFGPEKGVKSRTLSTILTCCIAEIPYFGGPTDDCGQVLYVLGEEHSSDVVARIRAQCIDLGIDFPSIDWADRIHFMDGAGVRLEREDRRNWFLEKTRNYDLVVFDPLRRLYSGRENSNDEMGSFLTPFRQEINRRYGTERPLTFVGVHHTGKIDELQTDLTRMANWSRGASDLVSILDLGYFQQKYRDSEGRHCLKIYIQGRFPPIDEIKIIDRGDGTGGFLLT